MKKTMILLVFVFAAVPSFGSDLSKAMFKAAGQVAGSDGWYKALSPYVERTSTNSLGRLTPHGFVALREEFTELKTELLKRNPPLDLKTELSLAYSYGFRPKRSAKQAILKIQRAITHAGQTVIVDADIKGFFDSVDHGILLKLVQRRISDPRVMRLIRGWLEAGVMENEVYEPPDGTGTPQGA